MSSYFSERQTRSMNTLSIQRPRPSIEMRTLAASNVPVKAAPVNWLPWSVLNISGLPYRASASSSAATPERGVHRVGEPPGENRPVRPVDGRDKIEEARPIGM